jgi:iron complex outermembrane receptor protein
VVINADAGNGVGYTGIRIRGTDATRINVTLNGIPYNDAESMGTFFVNLPDFSSSVNSIQIQSEEQELPPMELALLVQHSI